MMAPTKGTMPWNLVLLSLCFFISYIEGGKAAKRGGRHDSGKLVATLCHYYSDGAMGCKECFEVARSHRSNHNSTLLPPCKSVQGIKRKNWTVDDGIIPQGIAELNTTKRFTLASCAFYFNNKTFTCVATRPQCDNLTEVECVNNTSWSGRYEGSITEGFRCSAPPINGSKPAKHFNGTWSSTSKTSPATTPTTAATIAISSTTKNLSEAVSVISHSPSKRNVTLPATNSTKHPSTMATLLFGQASDSANEVHRIPDQTTLTSTSTSETKRLLISELAKPSSSTTDRIHSATMTTPQKSFTLTSLVTTQLQSSDTTEYSENCTTTSCTIFAETVAPNSTDAHNHTGTFGSNSTLVTMSHERQESSKSPVFASTLPATSQLVSVDGWSTNIPEVDAVLNKGGTNISTTHDFKMVLFDEVKTPSMTPSSTSSTKILNSTTALEVVFPTFNPNATSSKHPEPRRRQPIRRMY